jgi:hypothetical protein
MLKFFLAFSLLGATAVWSQQDFHLGVLGSGNTEQLSTITEMASSRGLAFASADAQWSCATQMADAEGMITQGVTTAIIMPACADVLPVILEAFRDSGVLSVVVVGGVTESTAQALLDQANGMRLYILGAEKDGLPRNSELTELIAKVSGEMSLEDGILQPEWSCSISQQSPIQVCWDTEWGKFPAVSASAIDLIVSDFSDGIGSSSTPYGELVGNGVLLAQPMVMVDEDWVTYVGFSDQSRRDELLQRLFDGFCPSCTVTEKICSKDGCPQRCNGQCTTENDRSCCLKSGMDPPP